MLINYYKHMKHMSSGKQKTLKQILFALDSHALDFFLDLRSSTIFHENFDG